MSIRYSRNFADLTQVFVIVVLQLLDLAHSNLDTWRARSAAEANDWNSVAYGNGFFVAVAASGRNRVMTSPDGITWTARSAAEDNAWNRIAYGNGTFVAVAGSG